MINFVHTVEQVSAEIRTAKDLLSCFNDFCEENLSFSDDEREQCYLGLMFMENMKKYKSLILTAEDIIRTQTDLLDDAVDNVTVKKDKNISLSDLILGRIYLQVCNAADEGKLLDTAVIFNANLGFGTAKTAEVKERLEQLISYGCLELVEQIDAVSYKVKLKRG